MFVIDLFIDLVYLTSMSAVRTHLIQSQIVSEVNMANYEASYRQLSEWTAENREEIARADLKVDT